METLIGDGPIQVNAMVPSISIRNRVVLVGSLDTPPGPATGQTLDRQPSARQQSMAGDCLIGIFGTGRHIAAGIADKA